jgi:FKBP-type peptidyl-prolyl cis-trans isomerase FklB
MKKLWMAVFCIPFVAGAALAVEKAELKDQNDKTSYSIGYQIGGDFKHQGVNINPDAVVKGIQDALSGDKPLMTMEEMNGILVDVKKKIIVAQQAELKKIAQKNLTEGEAFSETNGKKEGVKTLPSGLQYKVIKEGSGASPKATDMVSVHYRGTLIDGKEFDNSYVRNKPATFQVERVIPGWTEALKLMNAGSKWEIFIPPKLAYGDAGAAGVIPPNSTLIFEIELLSIGQEAPKAG